MKLRTKILVAVLACIAAVCGLSQIVQHRRADALMDRLSADNLARAEQTQWTWLGNLQHACETSLVDTMARGEMDRFQQLLDEQREVRGVRELSLADREGRIAFSSDPARVGARLPDALRREVAASSDPIRRRVDGDFEIHTPLAVSPGCLDCHPDMQGAPIAGVLSYRFSGEALDEARAAWAGFVARLQDSLLGNALASGLAMIGLVGLVMSWCIHTLVAKPLERVGGALQTGSAEVGAAAAAIAAASEEQAEGATRQAAALEETSASIEEISSMTRTNATHAAEARQLAGEARSAAEAGVEAMARMQATMREIEASNANVRAILKTIDEIAFQTNILALNAAVEAARAGEAGMGFGVVAEEVRNLAQRSAEAARSTATKISDAMQKVQAGSRITAEVSRQLETIVLKVRAEDEVSARIAAASVEQARAIEQITSAMNEVDGVTRHAASGAEETAGAAEELNGQVGTLRDSVGELLALVHGSPRRPSAFQPQPARAWSEPAMLRAAHPVSGEARPQPAVHRPALPSNRATRSPCVARSGESSR